MNMDFLTAVNKSSGTPFKTPGSFGAAEPGFREQINQAMRDNDRKNEYAVEKKPVGKPRNSAKAGEKTNAPEKTVPRDGGNADNKTAGVKASEYAKDASETDDRKTASTGDDSGFYGELKEAETSETENLYAFTPPPDETHAPDGLDGLEDASASSSTDAQIFPLELTNDDSGLAAIINMQETAENAGGEDGSGAALNGNAVEVPVAVSEVILQMATGRMDVTPPQETTDVNVPQNASLSGGDANGQLATMTEMAKIAEDVESANAESARPGVKDVLENALLQKDPAAAQNPGRNDAASLRGGEVKNEAPVESRTAANSELVETLKQSAAASSDDDDLLLERMAAQALRSREGAAFAKASEPVGRTVHAAEASVQVTSGTAKAEAPVPTRSVNVPDKDFIVQLAGRIQAQIRGGREMIRIQLHPEELGRLEIRAESGRNGIIARIAAESIDVKKMLEGNIQSLQQTLEARGLKIDRLHIVVEDNAYAEFADGGRYGNAGQGLHNSEASELSKSNGAGIESPEEDDPDDLSAEAEQRGVGFYTVA